MNKDIAVRYIFRGNEVLKLAPDQFHVDGYALTIHQDAANCRFIPEDLEMMSTFMLHAKKVIEGSMAISDMKDVHV